MSSSTSPTSSSSRPPSKFAVRAHASCLTLPPPRARLHKEAGGAAPAQGGGEEEQGFHQCRWGYHNLSVVEDVVENYWSAQIPVDVIWNDDDHMDARKDLMLSPVNYSHPKLLAFLDMLQFHWIL
ncbi:hypothetical protein ZWY2020_056480 [Hordeum vulgare]|nr:hypothetical protein ZWY2020_056480 [Hordeum vulgare]